MKKFTLLLAAALVAATTLAAVPPRLSVSRAQAHNQAVPTAFKGIPGLNVPAARAFSTSTHFTSTPLLSREDAPEIIEELPEEAVSEVYESYGEGFYLFWGIALDYGTNYCYANVGIYEDEASEEIAVYLQNPVAGYPNGTYVKGTYDLTTGKIVVKYPQAIEWYEAENTGEIVYSYIGVLSLDEEEMTYVYAGDEEQTVTYTVDDFGRITMEELGGLTEDGFPSKILGCYDQYTDEESGELIQAWFGYGDASHAYSIINTETEELPEGLETETWALVGADGSYQWVDVAKDDDHFYLVDFSAIVAEEGECGVVVGDIDGDQVTFASGQCIGYSDNYELYFFFAAYDMIWDEEYEEYVYGLATDITFTYDADKKMLTCNEELKAMGSNASASTFYAESIYDTPVIRYQTDADMNANPVDPECVWLADYREYDYDYYEIDWNAPLLNVNGFLLDSDRMYFNVFYDGELVTFDPETYIGLEEPLTNIPMFFEDENWDFQVSAPYIYLYLYEFDVQEVGLKVYYEGTDGVLYSSNLVNQETGFAGLRTIDTTATGIRSITYTNLNGQTVSEPATGLYIRTTTFNNGLRRVDKVIIR